MEQGVCVCEIAPSGGIVPCLYHAAVITEHQKMYAALKAISGGQVSDPGQVADIALIDVRYRTVR